jgi:hypothetical protein
MDSWGVQVDAPMKTLLTFLIAAEFIAIDCIG